MWLMISNKLLWGQDDEPPPNAPHKDLAVFALHGLERLCGSTATVGHTLVIVGLRGTQNGR